MTETYLLDGREATAAELINAAKQYGYTGHDDFIFFTSEAARYLRNNGCIVTDNPPERS